MRHVLVLVTVLCVMALCGALYAIFWKSNSNCEATLILTRSLESAVASGPLQTPDEAARTKAFFDDVYSKLNC